MASDDTLSLSMFWAGALMVFTPLVFAASVLGVWWRHHGRARHVDKGTGTSIMGTGPHDERR